MTGGFIIGLICGWLVAGGIVMSMAFRGELAGEPVGIGDMPLIIGGVLLWPLLIYPEEDGDA